MNASPRLRAALAIVAFLALGACAPRVVGEITDMSPLVDVVAPRFELDPAETRIERFDPPGAGAGLVVTLTVNVSNPNPFDMVLDRVDYRLVLAGERAFAQTLEPSLLVPGLGSARWQWTLEAPLADLPQLWRAVVGSFAGQPLPFEVEGQLRFLSEVFIFSTGVRPLFSGALRARQTILPPRLSVAHGSAKTVVARADAPALRFVLELTNPGDVGVFVSARGLTLGLLAAEADTAAELAPPTADDRDAVVVVGAFDLSPVPLPDGATVRREVVVVLDLQRLGAAGVERVSALLAGEPTRFVIDGAYAYDVLGVDSFEVPLAGALWGAFGR